MFLLGVLLTTSLKSQTSNKQNFISAKNEIEQMLTGQRPLDYERAVFITENAYYDNANSYQDFQLELNEHQYDIMLLVNKLSEFQKTKKKTTLLVSKDSASLNNYRLLTNYTLFRYFTDTVKYFRGGEHYIHAPYSYSFKDPLATDKWENSQVLHLLHSNTHSGNCVALTSLYKILSLRLQANANLCTTQGHIFISHTDENGRKYNIELASKTFPGTGSIEILTHTSDEASRKGFAMRELDLKQSVGLCLINLAKTYEYKYGDKTDKFLLDCAELAIKYDSLNLNAMLLKAEVLENQLLANGNDIQKLKATDKFISYQKYINRLYNLGYREMPSEMKRLVLSAITKDYKIIPNAKDNTYYPFQSIDKNYKRTYSMSNGMFEEADISKPKEKYFHTVFDTKQRKIIAFEATDTLSGYDFDPAVFAWQIDPLYKKYPFQSPYSAFNNNPIFFNDPTGAEGEPVNGGTLPEITISASSPSKSNSVGLTTDMLRSFARQSGIGGAGVQFNRTVGKRFESMALIEFLAVGRQIPHSTPARGEAYGVPTTIPDASTNVNIFYSKPPATFGKITVPNASIFEVKAYKGVLTLSTSRGQLKAIIDIAARANNALGGKPSAVTLITTADTFVGADLVSYATQNNVNLFQSTAMYDTDNNSIFFSSPILKNPHEGDGNMPFSLEQIHFDYPTNYMSTLPNIPENPADPDPEEVE